MAFKNLFKTLFTVGDIQDSLLPVKGRKYDLRPVDQLGLYLYYVGSRMRYKDLAQRFGILPNTVGKYIASMRIRIVEKLLKHPASKIKFPNSDKMKHYAHLVSLRDPAVKDVIGFVDGLKIPVQCCDDPDVQNSYYDGYNHDTMVNNVLLFSPLGKIVYAGINFFRSWHDSQVCSFLIQNVLRDIGPYKICVDQGFPRSGELHDKFVGPISKRRRKKLSNIVRRLLLKQSNRYVFF